MASPWAGGRNSHAAHPYLRGSEGGGCSALRRSAWRARAQLLYEAPPRPPADHEAEAREWPICLWLQVFSLQTWPCQVSPFPCGMHLPRTQAWLPTAERPWSWVGHFHSSIHSSLEGERFPGEFPRQGPGARGAQEQRDSLVSPSSSRNTTL